MIKHQLAYLLGLMMGLIGAIISINLQNSSLAMMFAVFMGLISFAISFMLGQIDKEKKN